MTKIEKLRKLHEDTLDYDHPFQSRRIDELFDVLEDALPALLDVAELAERHRRELVDYGCAEDDDPEYDCISFEADPMCRRCEALLTWDTVLSKLGVGA